jgi:hypothetical protein
LVGWRRIDHQMRGIIAISRHRLDSRFMVATPEMLSKSGHGDFRICAEPDLRIVVEHPRHSFAPRSNSLIERSDGSNT